MKIVEYQIEHWAKFTNVKVRYLLNNEILKLLPFTCNEIHQTFSILTTVFVQDAFVHVPTVYYSYFASC